VRPLVVLRLPCRRQEQLPTRLVIALAFLLSLHLNKNLIRHDARQHHWFNGELMNENVLQTSSQLGETSA
jgi:hypothetical protein